MIKKATERKVGTVLSYFSILISFIIGFCVTPIILRTLGDSEYGVYTLVASLCAYLNIIEQGLSDTVVKYIIKFNVSKSTEKVEHLSAVVLLINLLLSLVTVIVGAILYKSLPTLYKSSMTVAEISVAQRLLVLMIANLIVTFMSNLYQGILTANEKFILLRTTEIMNQIISNAVIVAVLFLGGRSFEIVVVTLCCNTLLAVYKFIYCKRQFHHHAQIHKGAFTKELYLDLVKYFLAVLIVVLVGQIYWKLDNIIISFMMGATFVTVYSIGMTFHKYLEKFSNTISKIMTPKVFKEVLSGKDKEVVTDELIKISRIQAYGVYLALCGLIVYGNDFLRLWIGDSYGEAYAITLITLIPYSFEIVGNIRNVILQAHDLYMKTSLLKLGVSILNIVLTILLVKIDGIVGAAIGTGIGILVGQFGINWLLLKNQCCNLKRYYKEVYLRLTVLVLIMLVLGLLSKQMISIINWLTFFGVASVYGIIFCVLLWLIVLKTNEKKIISRGIGRLIHVRGDLK